VELWQLLEIELQHAGSVEDRCRNARKAVEELRRAILRAALDGDLVKPPKYIESSASMLVRLAAERVTGLGVSPKHQGKVLNHLKTMDIPMSDVSVEGMILALLREKRSGLTPEELFHALNFVDRDVDQFFFQLKKLRSKGLIGIGDQYLVISDAYSQA
jgi:hypothetical protein